MLESAKTPQKMSALARKTKTTLAVGKKYAEALADAKYLDRTQDNGDPAYQTNMEGLEFLKDLKKPAKGLERFNKYWQA